MRHIYLVALCILALSCYSNAQLMPGSDGLFHYTDSCDLTDPCKYLSIDTSQVYRWEIDVPGKSFLDQAYSAPNALITSKGVPYASNADYMFELAIPSFP